jgi:hypothetical protein
MKEVFKNVKMWWIWNFKLKHHINEDELSKLSFSSLAQLRDYLGLFSQRKDKTIPQSKFKIKEQILVEKEIVANFNKDLKNVSKDLL